jgi:CheY-like chemotaxis protein
VTAGLGAAGVRFSVRDTGIGFARDKQRAIFEAFEQPEHALASLRERFALAVIAVGMDDFLSKPISAAGLWGVLDRGAKA